MANTQGHLCVVPLVLKEEATDLVHDIVNKKNKAVSQQNSENGVCLDA